MPCLNLGKEKNQKGLDFDHQNTKAQNPVQKFFFHANLKNKTKKTKKKKHETKMSSLNLVDIISL